MCRMCNDPQVTIADLRAQMFRAIEDFGCLIQYVMAEPGLPAFAYTIGLTEQNLPELYIQGCAPEQAAALLNGAAEAITGGEPRAGELYVGPDGRDYRLTPMDTVDELLGALECYGAQVRGLELVPVGWGRR